MTLVVAACALSAAVAARAEAPAAAPPPPPDPGATQETVLGIADLVQAALRYNPALRAALRSREAAAGAVDAAAAYANPRLEALSGSNRARLPGVTGGAVTGWGVSQLIENPAVREARIAGARHGQTGTDWQAGITANELVAQVRLKAFEYLLRREEAAAAADAAALLEEIRSRVQVRVDSGEAPRYEAIKAAAEVANARQQQAAARLRVEQAGLALERLAAGRLPPRWRLAATLGDAADLPPLATLQREALEHNPELQFLRSEVRRREARLDESRASRLPGVELRYGQVRDPEVRQAVLTATVQVPLFDRRSGPIAEAGAELERSRTLLDGRQVELDRQLQSAAQALEVARLRADALATGALPGAEAALRVAQAAYRFGERGILDVLDAQRLLRSIRADLIDARFQVQAAAIELEQLAGRYAVPESTLSRPIP
ncbi:MULTISPECIES: TolC family protein [Ramlibacter]|uniref:TolC family protein n=1 Tax=Ramlibacter TaxID=174951 RepID=UPI001E379DE9|nr:MULTISPECIES: TolC family protein [Ramlibacter]